MQASLTRLTIGLTLVFAGQLAAAQCVCRCVGVEVKALCRNSIDLPPICAPQICPIVLPTIAPIPTPRVPPIGTTACREMQVLNPATNRHEWKAVCR